MEKGRDSRRRRCRRRRPIAIPIRTRSEVKDGCQVEADLCGGGGGCVGSGTVPANAQRVGRSEVGERPHPSTC